MTSERWASVRGYEGLYEVSDLGRVKALARNTTDRLGRRLTVKEVVRKPFAQKSGHLRVKLTKDGSSKTAAVHRLVLEAFVGPCPEGMECLHKDDIPSNNRLDNLRWGTRLENHQDRRKNGRQVNASQTHCLRGHPLEGENLSEWALKKGLRSCLACDRGRGHIRNRSLPSHLLQEVTDDYFNRIIQKEHSTIG